MHSFNQRQFPEFDYPPQVQSICFCGLDETYRPINTQHHANSGIGQ